MLDSPEKSSPALLGAKIAPSSLSQLVKLKDFLAGSFKGATFGSMKMDDCLTAIDDAINALEQQNRR